VATQESKIKKGETIMHTQSEPARLADKPEDYARFKLERRHIQQWEDGLRIDTAAPNPRTSAS
jgi:hypothetical protein